MSVQSRILPPGKYIIADPALLIDADDYHLCIECNNSDFADGELISIQNRDCYVARTAIHDGMVQSSAGHDINITSGLIGIFPADLFSLYKNEFPVVRFDRAFHAIADRGFVAFGTLTIDTSDENSISDDDMIKAVDEFEDEFEDDSVIVSKYFKGSFQ